MAVIHEVAAIADARQSAALDGADVHRDAFADGAARSDFEPCRLAAITEILRRPAERRKRRYRAIGADPRVPGDGDMRDKRTTCADDRVATDHAIRPDRGALADHCAFFNPRGGIDRTHRGVRYQPASFGANISDFSAG